MPRQVITFHYTLKDKPGKILDSSGDKEPISFLTGSGQIIAGLEAVLINLKKDDMKEVFIPYQEAYGPYDQQLIYQVSKDKFPIQEITIGDIFQIQKDDIHQMVTVIDILDSDVMLDANHPLAGKDLYFSIKIVEIRAATPEEIAHGHAHGEGGHHHH